MNTNLEKDWLHRLLRRDFLTTSASGLGGVALGSLLAKDGLASESLAANRATQTKLSHFPAKAKACIFIYMAGGPSHVDLFDPKPILNNRDGQKMPDSLLKNVEFAFIKKDEAVLKGSPAKFRPRGECGIEYSDLIPGIASYADDIALIRTMHGEQFNHHPGQLLLSCGKAEMGRPHHWLLVVVWPWQRSRRPARIRRADRRTRREWWILELVQRISTFHLSRRTVSRSW